MMENQIEDRIIAATLAEIAAVGYQQLSLRKLANRLKMTTGAIYRHFRDKEELFYRATVVLSQRVAAALPDDQGMSAFERLLTVAQRFCQLVQEQPQLMDFLFFNPSLTTVYQQEQTDFSFLRLVRELSDQVNPGALTNPQFFTQLWAFIQGYALLIKNGVTSYRPEVVRLTLNQLAGRREQ